jgi:hypothetical protein
MYVEKYLEEISDENSLHQLTQKYLEDGKKTVLMKC